MKERFKRLKKVWSEESEKMQLGDWMSIVFVIIACAVLAVSYQTTKRLNETANEVIDVQKEAIVQKEEKITELTKEVGGLFQQIRKKDEKIAELLAPKLIMEIGTFSKGPITYSTYSTEEEARMKEKMVVEEGDYLVVLEYDEEIIIKEITISTDNETFCPELRKNERLPAVSFLQHISSDEVCLITINYQYNDCVKSRYVAVKTVY